MVNILAVASVILLLFQANTSLVTDDGKEFMEHVHDGTLHIEEEASNNFTSQQIKGHYEKDRTEKWYKSRAHSGKLLPNRETKPLGISSYRTDTNVKKRVQTAVTVLGGSPKWKSMTDSGIPLASEAAPLARGITSDPEITLLMNRTPILETRRDQPSRSDFHYDKKTSPHGVKGIQDTNGEFKTSSSYKGVWVDKDTATQRKKLKITPTARSFRDDIRELKYEVRLMKAIVEKLVHASHMFTRKSGSVAHKNQMEPRSLKLMASRLAARQMIDGHTTDSQIKKSHSHA